jgi:RHH-type proline utilization regulon transcriptional repressor/proline dehydrogenase/delta 1-pyrroline-5-carboxylate dehydrogenase
VGPVEDALRRTTQDRPEVAILEGPVTCAGEVELRHYVHEQAVSMTLHRFGTPDRAFHALAERITQG